jgi:acetyl esterase/lipase
MLRSVAVAVLALSCLAAGAAPTAKTQSDSPLVMMLYPESVVPVSMVPDGLAPLPAGTKPRWIVKVPQPGVAVYLPPKEKRTGAAVVICPGGGYAGLAIDPEGHDVAKWLCSQGIAGIVLEYRLPNPAKHGDSWPLEDAQRAIRLARNHASQWGVDPKRVGIMGFSAGGHLAACTGTHFDHGSPKAADPVDRESCRPDFMVLVYPVITMTNDTACHRGSRTYLLGQTPDAKLMTYYSAELHVTSKTPPAFIIQAKDDVVKVQNSLLFSEALKKAGVPFDLQLYEKGGHGFGLGFQGGEVATWPGRWLDWMKRQSLLPGRAAVIAVKG